MKKIISLVIILTTLFALAIPANASVDYYGYTDEANNNNMAVPDTWYISYGDNELCKVEFLCQDGDALTMTYGSTDVYSSLDASARAKCSRGDIDNSLFTEADIADLLGVNASQVSKITINKKEYFLAKTVTNIDYQGSTYAIDTHYWVRITNGWLYLYQYAGIVYGDTYDSFVNVVISTSNYGISTGVTWKPNPSKVIG